MDAAAVRAMLRQHFEYASSERDLAHEIYHPDGVLEFPQSGKRVGGVANFRGRLIDRFEIPQPPPLRSRPV